MRLLTTAPLQHLYNIYIRRNIVHFRIHLQDKLDIEMYNMHVINNLKQEKMLHVDLRRGKKEYRSVYRNKGNCHVYCKSFKLINLELYTGTKVI